MATLRELRQFGATRVGQWACAWISEDRQGSLWMGIGDTEAEAIADARRELAEQGLVADEDGYFLEAELIEEDEDWNYVLECSH